MLDRLTQDRAISYKDGGRAGGNALRAKVVVRSRFVLKSSVGLAAAGVLVGFAASWTFAGRVDLQRSPDHVGHHVESPTSSALSVAEGAEPGSDPASRIAVGMGSPRRAAPGEL